MIYKNNELILYHLDINIRCCDINRADFIFTKTFVNISETLIMMINEEPGKYSVVPFSSVEDVIEYLESSVDEKVKKDQKDLS